MKPFLATLCAAFALLLSPFTMAQYDPQCEEKAQYAQYSQRCDQQREQHFNALLNQGYQALMKQQTSAGKAHLRQMQRAWMRERDSECRAIVANTVVGAGMAPGLSGLLARYLAAQLNHVEELHVAVHGTGGPACARQHHHALGDTALGWHDGDWIEPPGGSGRELVWFPEPVLAHDCYRAALGDPLLLRRSFPQTQRISARMSATRRDRLTARFPMLTPPHAAGDLGSVRVEARGATAEGERLTLIAGASGPTGELAAAVCAATALMVVRTPLTPGVHTTACRELTEGQLLHHTTHLGVRVQEFTGVARATSW